LNVHDQVSDLFAFKYVNGTSHLDASDHCKGSYITPLLLDFLPSHDVPVGIDASVFLDILSGNLQSLRIFSSRFSPL
jgi:hypothetical protein